MLQNARVKAFIIFELLRGNQQNYPSPQPRLRLTNQNLLSEAQVKNSFILQKCYVPF